MSIAIALVGCYLIGSIPFGLIAGKLLKGIDIRDYGSGNIGASNVLRTLGPVPAAIVFLLDTAKGLIAVKACESLAVNPWLVVVGALCAVLGHTFSVFLRFGGGKGVATTLGVILGFNPLVGTAGFGVWLAIVGLTRYISVASIVAAIAVAVMMHFWRSLNVPVAYQIFTDVAAIAIVSKHQSNIHRLLRGSEPKIGQTVKFSKAVLSEEDSGKGAKPDVPVEKPTCEASLGDN